MTQEEKDLAIRIFAKAMENTDNLQRNEVLATLSVEAARAIYANIQAQDHYDADKEEQLNQSRRAEEAAAYEAEWEAKQERLMKRREELREARKHATYYLVYKKDEYVYTYANKMYYTAEVKSTTKDVDSFLQTTFTVPYEDKRREVAVYMISKEEADNLLINHKKLGSHRTSKNLECNSTADFINLLECCPSAQKIDLTGQRIGKAIQL